MLLSFRSDSFSAIFVDQKKPLEKVQNQSVYLRRPGDHEGRPQRVSGSIYHHHLLLVLICRNSGSLNGCSHSSMKMLLKRFRLEFEDIVVITDVDKAPLAKK